MGQKMRADPVLIAISEDISLTGNAHTLMRPPASCASIDNQQANQNKAVKQQTDILTSMCGKVLGHYSMDRTLVLHIAIVICYIL